MRKHKEVDVRHEETIQRKENGTANRDMQMRDLK